MDNQSQERLWAPWRINYITGMLKDKVDGCFFCAAFKQDPQEKDKDNFILARRKKCFSILNKFPYNNGHIMVVPYKHTGLLEELDGEDLLDMAQHVNECTRVLRETVQPEGFNIGVNIGRAAGAGVVDHVHMHIVPRWNGDTNFMPVVSDMKVIVQSLQECYEILVDGFKK